jgi:hydrogenase expression/formation protein HypC
MCYAVPARITRLDAETALVDYGGVEKTVNVSLLESPQVGDYVLIHTGFAIEKLDQKSAEQALLEIRRSIDGTELPKGFHEQGPDESEPRQE